MKKLLRLGMVAKRLFKGVHRAVCALVFLLATQVVYPHDDLSGPVWTNGQFQFTLNGGLGVTYAIESSPDLVNWTAVVTNNDASDTRFITLDAQGSANFYRFRLIPHPLFAYAAAAEDNINMNGNGLVTDSFNSADTNLSTNGQYDPAKASTNGNVASVQGIVNIGNHTINGSLFLGPTATCTNNPFQITGTIYTNYNVQFPDVVLPTASWLPAVAVGGAYDFTTSGNYVVTDSKNITVEPGVTVTLKLTATNFSPITITVNGGTTNSGTLTMYQVSGTATMAGNSAPNVTRPQNFYYYGLPGVTSVTLGGNTNFVEAIYAPEASLTLNGGGNGNNLEGSFIVASMHLNGHLSFHFDESLLTLGPFR
jgi:hypothetical protein